MIWTVLLSHSPATMMFCPSAWTEPSETRSQNKSFLP
jgi:hypothetical protein